MFDQPQILVVRPDDLLTSWPIQRFRQSPDSGVAAAVDIDQEIGPVREIGAQEAPEQPLEGGGAIVGVDDDRQRIFYSHPAGF
jgi:hypothetical protein